MNHSAVPTRAAADYTALVQPGRIHGSLYTDRDIFAEEMETIFHRGWVYVAHGSELPDAGSFVTRKIGLQSVIVARDATGQVNVMYNRCTHRGATVCQRDKGQRPTFTCPYHAWSFAMDGRLVGVPAADAYPAEFDKAKLGLAHVAQVDSYAGFIFANLAAGGKSLRAHLGPGLRFFDQLVGLSPEGEISLTAGWMKHRMRCNWKVVLENQVDGYHAQAVHGSLLAANNSFATVRDRKHSSPARVQDVGMGHTDIDHASDYLTGERLFRWTGGAPESKFPDYIAAMEHSYGVAEGRRRLIAGPPHSMIFPNISLAELNIMVIQPVSPTETIHISTPVFFKGADELNRRTLRRSEGAIGPAGFLIADDSEIGELNQMGLSNRQPEWVELSRGISSEEIREDGSRVAGLMDETTQRGFWRQYRTVMAAGAR